MAGELVIVSLGVDPDHPPDFEKARAAARAVTADEIAENLWHTDLPLAVLPGDDELLEHSRQVLVQLVDRVESYVAGATADGVQHQQHKGELRIVASGVSYGGYPNQAAADLEAFKVFGLHRIAGLLD